MAESGKRISPFLVAFLLGVLICWIFTLLGGYEVCDEDPKDGCWEDESYLQMYIIVFYPTLFFGFVYFAPKILRLFGRITGRIFRLFVLDGGVEFTSGASMPPSSFEVNTTDNRVNVSKKVEDNPTNSISHPCSKCGKEIVSNHGVAKAAKVATYTPTSGWVGMTIGMALGGFPGLFLGGLMGGSAGYAKAVEEKKVCFDCKFK